MAFFRIKDCDVDILEAEIFHELKRRDLPDNSDLELFKSFDRQYSNVCRLLRRMDRYRMRRQGKIDAMESTVSWRITKPVRGIKQFFVKYFSTRQEPDSNELFPD